MPNQFQDISADDAHTLYTLLTVLQVEIPNLFKPAEESQVSGLDSENAPAPLHGIFKQFY